MASNVAKEVMLEKEIKNAPFQGLILAIFDPPKRVLELVGCYS